jgi:multiple antibiotic resistance protein
MLAAVLLSENSIFSLWEQAQTVVVMLGVILLAYILMLLGGRINKIVGRSGANVVSRIMGLVLSSVATTHILSGLADYAKIFPA